jgi:hypothetical protein
MLDPTKVFRARNRARNAREDANTLKVTDQDVEEFEPPRGLMETLMCPGVGPDMRAERREPVSSLDPG